MLLGGDNMDLALAKFVESKPAAGKLDAAQYGMLRRRVVLRRKPLGDQPPDKFLSVSWDAAGR